MLMSPATTTPPSQPRSCARAKGEPPGKEKRPKLEGRVQIPIADRNRRGEFKSP
jgi:hypothetical protein